MKTQINWTQLHSEAVEEFQRLIPLLFGPQNMSDADYAPAALKQASALIETISMAPAEIQNAFIENLPLFVACEIGRDDAKADATIAAQEAEEECDCDNCVEAREADKFGRDYDYDDEEESA